MNDFQNCVSYALCTLFGISVDLLDILNKFNGRM
jgi:hypothetical protein